MTELTLPWPPNVLNPNVKRHWAVKARAAKKFRADCRILAKQCIPALENEVIKMTVIFRPPDRRKRDKDNMIASMKSGFDGIAEAWGVNDVRFDPQYLIGNVVKHGEVMIEVIEKLTHGGGG